MKTAKLRMIALLLGALTLAGGLVVVLPSLAAPPAQDTPPAPVENLSIADETCLSCHGSPGISMQLGNGETLGLYLPEEVYQQSVHGEQGYACVQCHRTVGNYPHPPYSAEDARQVTLDFYPLCQYCHPSQFEATEDSVHADALAEGNRNAAVCTDCHGSHTVQRLTDPQTRELTPEARLWVPQTCAKCHYAIYEKYKDSVHGAALLEEGNTDVPTCIDCHGVHSIEDPTTAAFRLRSPEICAQCHADEALMEKYDISTNVFDTYVSDFHGTTVTLFEKEHPDQETNKAVCYDCHGVHDIAASDDPEKGLQLKQNLLARCQECHPDASENFPTAWLSHYIPDAQRYPMVFTVNVFYSLFIPGVLGGMALLVVLDIGSILRRRARLRGERLAPPPAAPPEAAVGRESPGAVADETVAPEAPPATEVVGPVEPAPPQDLPLEPAHPEETPVEPQQTGADVPAPPEPGEDTEPDQENPRG